MIAIPAGLAAFAATWWRAFLGFAVAAPLFFLVGQCDGRASERAKADAERAKANVEAITVDGTAKEAAAAERLSDQKNTQRVEEELTDAIATIPDEKPDAVRVALGCQRLRASGAGEADLPGICRSGGGAEASTHR